MYTINEPIATGNLKECVHKEIHKKGFLLPIWMSRDIAVENNKFNLKKRERKIRESVEAASRNLNAR